MTSERTQLDRKLCHEGIMEYCDEENCVYNRVLTLLGKTYTFSILRILAREGTVRFNDVVKAVEGSPKTITDRLRELVKEGLVKREAFAEIPPRVEYSLTEMGEDLKPLMSYLKEWARKWT